MIPYILAFFGMLLYVLHHRFKKRKLPPGPMPLPFVGNLFEMVRTGGEPPEAFAKLAKKYGNIYSFTLGVVPYVVVCGGEAIRDGLRTGDYDARIEEPWLLDHSYGKKIGIILSDRTFWQDVRRISTKIMKEYGFGNQMTMESLITEELEEFFKAFLEDRDADGTVYIEDTFSRPMLNIICAIVTGSRYDYTDPQFRRHLGALRRFLKSCQAGSTNFFGAYPFLANYLPGRLSGFDKMHKVNLELLQYAAEMVQARRNLGHYKNNPASFTDKFLQEIDNNEHSSDPIYTDRNLVTVINDLFLAGADTTGNSCAYGVRTMVQYPEVQKKMHAEIDEFIGKGQMIRWDDRYRLKYSFATVYEILRSYHLAPFVCRRTTSTSKLGIYDIPEGTLVLFNLISAHWESSVWGDPQNFRPERFLDKNGNLVNTDKILTFSYGKRNCMGEATAATNLFMIFTNLVRTFRFEVDPKSGIPVSETAPGLTYSPKPFRVRMERR